MNLLSITPAALRSAVAILVAIVLSPQTQPSARAQTSESSSVDASKDSAMFKPWTGPYGGVPPWDQVQPDQFVAAFDLALQVAAADIERIARNDQPPTIDNTLVALDEAGAELQRLETLFSVHANNLNTGPIPEAERVVSPKLSQHEDSIVQNEMLFQRIAALRDSDAVQQATSATQRLVEEQYQSFVRRGANLPVDQKAKLSEINTRLAQLFTEFSQNVLEDERRWVTWIDDPDDLAGLPESTVDAMAEAAKAEDKPEGRWAVTNTRSSMDPFLTYADNRELREVVWRNYYSRSDHGDQYDNKEVIREIVALRLQRARLLGFPTHAHWRLQRSMAKTPAATMELMMQVWPKAVARVEEEVADMQRIADREREAVGQPKINIEPWDYRYYAEKVRQEKYDLDFNLAKPYLQLENLRQAMMWVASELFDLQFSEKPSLPVFHPDVRVWEVSQADGSPVGLFYLDPYARSGKRSGAWMSEYRAQRRIPEVVLPIVSNNSNFIRPADGQPALISWDDAVTLFHEFGHGLHGLLSSVDYKSQAGTRVVRDYVEFPSQLFEHWLMTDEVLQRFATHYRTGEPMPQELLQRIRRASKFNEGFATVEYLASAIVDMRLHTETSDQIDPDDFERRVLDEIGMPPQIVMRHRLPHFMHLFSSDSYSAGYYSYLWSDAITADAAEAFEQAPGGYFDRELAASLRAHVLQVGDTIDAAESFRRFRGRDVDTEALLRKRGFPVD